MRFPAAAVCALGLVAVGHAISVAEVEVGPDGKFGDPCADHGDSCAACVSDSRCGWCSSSQRCIAGGLTGPKLEHCPDGYWQFAFCKDAACAEYTECSACLADDLCGWCSGAAEEGIASSCLEGNKTRPSDVQCAGSWIVSPVVSGVAADAAARLVVEHLAMLRDTCTAAGFEAIKTASLDSVLPGRPAPAILSVSPELGPEFGGTVVTITGAHFVEQADGVDDSKVGAPGEEPNPVGAQVLVGGLPCANVHVRSASVITCETPALPRGAERESLPVEVRIAGTTSNQTAGAAAAAAEGPAARPEDHTVAAAFSYGQLTVLSVEPATARTEGGAALTVRGAFMGPRPQGLRITVGGKPCLAVTPLDNESVQCIVPPGTGLLLEVSVTISGYSNANPGNQFFSYEEPRVVSIKPTHGPTTGNTTITVLGNNFGPAEGAPIVFFDGVPCRQTVRISHSALRCLVPPGAGAAHKVVVLVPSLLPAGEHSLQGRFSRQQHVTYGFDEPVVTGVTPADGRTMGGDVISIHGRNFASGLPHEWQPDELGVGLNADQKAALAVLHRVIDEGNLAPSMKQYAKSLLWTMDVPHRAADGVEGESPVSHVATAMVHAARHSLRPDEARTNLCIHCTNSMCAQEVCITECPQQCRTYAKADQRIADERRKNAPVALNRLRDVLDDVGKTSGAAAMAFIVLREVAARQQPMAEDSGIAVADVPVGVNYTHATPEQEQSRDEASEANSEQVNRLRAPCHPGVPDYTPFGRKCVHAYVGGRHCSHMEVVGANEITCTTPPGVGRGHEVTVRYAGATSTFGGDGKVTFDYDPPAVRAIFPNHTSTLGGVTITVHGNNFGEENNAPRITVGGKHCVYSAWIDDHTLECGVPPNIGDQHNVVVAVGNQSSSQQVRFDYDDPVITGAKPNHGAPKGGYWIEVFGYNFGPFQNDPKISVRGQPCVESKWVSDSVVKCLVPPGVGHHRAIQVDVAGQVALPNQFFSYDGPIVNSATPANCSTRGGCRIEISGANFGVERHPTLGVTVDGEECTNMEHLGRDKLACIVAPGSGHNLQISVELSGLPSEPNELFSYYAPVVSHAAPSHGFGEGQIIVIHGSEFGEEEPAKEEDLQIKIGDKPCNKSTWMAFDRVACALPSGVGSNLPIRVLLRGQWSQPGGRFDYDPPRLHHISPAHGPTVGATELTLHGTNFADGMRVLLGDAAHRYECHTVRILSDKEARCTTPPGTGGDHDLELVQGGRRYVQTRAHGVDLLLALPVRDNKQGVADRAVPDVDKAVVDALHGKQGRRSALEMLGERSAIEFAAPKPDPEDMYADVGPVEESADVLLLPADGRPHVRFSFDTPEVDSITPDHGPAEGGTEVHIFGRNFGPPGTMPRILVDVRKGSDIEGDHKVHQGLDSCRNTSWVSQTEIVCITRAGIDDARKIVVDIDGRRSRAVDLFDYDTPRVFSLSPDHGRPRGGDKIRIVGVNYGTADTGTLRAWIGGRACTNVRWISNTEMEVTTPFGDSTHQRVQVEVTDRKSEPVDLFHYDAPIVTGISPNNRRIHGGGEIAVYGKNFGGPQNERRPTVTINGSPCQATWWVSDAEAKCKVPAGLGHKLSVVVHLGNLQSGANELFSYTDVDCVMGEWTDWTECNHPCRGGGLGAGHAWNGPGVEQRGHRLVVRPENGGKKCPEPVEERICEDTPCPVHCEATEWSDWSQCSQECSGFGIEFGHGHEGAGKQERSRKVLRKAAGGGRPCPTALYEERKCNTHECDADCKMTPWSEWGECSRACNGQGAAAGHEHEGPGEQRRTREVDKPPKGKGAKCGATEETRTCNTDTCPIDCEMEESVSWGPCNATCGGGAQVKKQGVKRYPKHGGKECPDPSSVFRPCNTQPCPVDCVPGEWGSWGECSAPGFGGVERRSREPKVQAAHGGKACSNMEQERPCNVGSPGLAEAAPKGGGQVSVGNSNAVDAHAPVMALRKGASTALLQFTVPATPAASAVLRLFVKEWQQETDALVVSAVRGDGAARQLGSTICTLARTLTHKGGRSGAAFVRCDVTTLASGAAGKDLSLALSATGSGTIKVASLANADTAKRPALFLTEGPQGRANATTRASSASWISSKMQTQAGSGWDAAVAYIGAERGDERRSLLTFTIPRVSGTVRLARLLVVRAEGNKRVLENMRVATTNAFDADSVSWRTAPQRGTEVSSKALHVETKGQDVFVSDLDVAKLGAASGSTVRLYLDTKANPFGVASIHGASNAALAPTLQLEFEPAGDAFIEVGTATVNGGTKEGSTEFKFTKQFGQPPVVVMLPNSRGGNPASIRIKGVTKEGFTATVVEPRGNDGPHLAMHVAYMAVSPGVHTLPDGRVVEAGRVQTRLQAAGKGRTDDLLQGWEEVRLHGGFKEEPAFVTAVQTMRNEERNVPRTWSAPWLTVATKDVTAKSAQVSLERSETAGWGSVRNDETIGYIAVESGGGEFVNPDGSGSVVYASLLTDRRVRGWADGTSTVRFGKDMETQTPLVVGSQSSRYGPNGGWLRMHSASRTSVALRIDEDIARDSDRSHTTEQVSVVAWSKAFSAKLAKK